MLQKKRLCIIGAGITGLSAAHHLLSQNLPWEITFIEKSFKVSGRATSRNIQGFTFDTGATTLNFAHISHNEKLQNLVKNLVPGRCEIEKDIYVFDKDHKVEQSSHQQNSKNFSFKEGILSLGTALQKDLLLMGAHFKMQEQVFNLVQVNNNQWEVSYKEDLTHQDKREPKVTTGIFDCVLVTAPSPQASVLLQKCSFESERKQHVIDKLEKVEYTSQLSVLIGLNKTIEKPYFALLNLDRQSDIAWLHFESDKKGHAPEGKSSLVVQMADAYSKKNYNFTDKQAVFDEIVSKLRLLDIQIESEDLMFYEIKKWKFSLPKNTEAYPIQHFSLPEINLFFAGDYLMQKARVLGTAEVGQEIAETLNLKQKL